MKVEQEQYTPKEKYDKIKELLAIAKILTWCGLGNIRFECEEKEIKK